MSATNYKIFISLLAIGTVILAVSTYTQSKLKEEALSKIESLNMELATSNVSLEEELKKKQRLLTEKDNLLTSEKKLLYKLDSIQKGILKGSSEKVLLDLANIKREVEEKTSLIDHKDNLISDIESDNQSLKDLIRQHKEDVQKHKEDIVGFQEYIRNLKDSMKHFRQLHEGYNDYIAIHKERNQVKITGKNLGGKDIVGNITNRQFSQDKEYQSVIISLSGYNGAYGELSLQLYMKSHQNPNIILKIGSRKKFDRNTKNVILNMENSETGIYDVAIFHGMHKMSDYEFKFRIDR